jgi:hypothetical protein
MREVIALFTPMDTIEGTASGTTVVAFRSTQDLDALLPALRRILTGTTTGTV